ncbi:hypothetical protein SmphiM6_86 [Sinorhizobium phage phiM6]|nr:hypothetical protein SmphiM6_86 [Sinorhizobium phage phiM6]
MKFTMDQDFIEVPSGEGVQVGDYLGLVCYPTRPEAKPFPAWASWVEVMEIGKDYFVVNFLSEEGPHRITTRRDRSGIGCNKWVKKITTREYKADQEPLDDEETL